MNTTELTLHLPESEALFLQGFADKHKVPISETPAVLPSLCDCSERSFEA